MPIRQYKKLKIKLDAQSFMQYLLPLQEVLLSAPVLTSRGYRPLKMNFEDQLMIIMDVYPSPVKAPMNCPFLTTG